MFILAICLLLLSLAGLVDAYFDKRKELKAAIFHLEAKDDEITNLKQLVKQQEDLDHIRLNTIEEQNKKIELLQKNLNEMENFNCILNKENTKLMTKLVKVEKLSTKKKTTKKVAVKKKKA